MPKLNPYLGCQFYRHYRRRQKKTMKATERKINDLNGG